MELLKASSAPDAIRTIAAYLRESVRKAREKYWRELWTGTQAMLREHYERAPPDEIELPSGKIQPINAPTRYPGGKYVAPGPEVPLFDLGGYDQVFTRPRRLGRLLRDECEPLPSTWSALFYERVAWPVERLREGQHPFRLFLDVKRVNWTVTIPIHDALDPWTEPNFKAKAPGGFPIPVNVPFRGYIVVDDRTSLPTYCQWLTLYLAQRMYLTQEEEGCAMRAFFSSRSANLENARYVAYERMKRRFVQPVAGRVSFSNYFWKSSDAVLRENSWQEPAAPIDPTSPFIELKALRMTAPALHRAVLHRIKLGTVTPVDVRGRICVRHDEVDRVDQKRTANAEVRRKSPYSVSQRSEWLRRMQTSGITLGAARRKLARWVNESGLSAEQIDQLVRSGSRRQRIGTGTGTG